MSINVNGNVISRFGDRLPVPYLDKIMVYNNEITIKVALYFEDKEERDGEIYAEYMNSLEDLNFIVQAVMDGGLQEDEYISEEDYHLKYGPVVSGTGGTQLFSRLLTGDINILETAVVDDNSYPEDASATLMEKYFFMHNLQYNNIETITAREEGGVVITGFLRPNNSNILINEPLALGSFTEELIYTSSGTPVRKYSKEFTIVSARDRTCGFDSVATFIEAMSSGLEVSFMSYTTSLADINLKESELQSIKSNTGTGAILKAQISDMSYEKVSQDARIGGTKITIFKTTAGDYYDEQILQSIDSTYYGNVSLTNEDIINSFLSLIGTTNVDSLQEKFDNLAYILAIHGNSIDIIPRLNEFRKTFVETSTMNSVGRFHERLEILLYNSNNEVKRGTRLRKFLNLSPVVVDARIEYMRPYAPPTHSGEHNLQHPSQYIYVHNSKLGSYAMPGSFEPLTDSELISSYLGAEATVATFKEIEDERYAEAKSHYEEFLHNAYWFVQNTGEKGQDGAGIGNTSEKWTGSRHESTKRKQDRNTNLSTFNGKIVFWDGDDVELGGELSGEYARFKDSHQIVAKKHPLRENDDPAKAASFRAYGPDFLVPHNSDYWGPQGITVNWRPNDADSYREIHVKIFREPAVFSKSNPSGYYDEYTITDGMNRSLSDQEVWEAEGGLERVGELGSKSVDNFGPGLTGVRPTRYNFQSTAAGVVMITATMDKYSRDKHKTDLENTYKSDHGAPERLAEKYSYHGKLLISWKNFRKSYSEYLKAAWNTQGANETAAGWGAALTLAGEIVYIDYNMYMSGFVFFDYEKSIRTLSAISKIFDVNRVESLFGKQITQNQFRLSHTEVKKIFNLNNYGDGEIYTYDNGTLPQPATFDDRSYPYYENGTIVTYYDHDSGQPSAISTPSHISIDSIKDYDNVTDHFGSGMGTTVEQKTTTGVKTEGTYFIPRNFEFTHVDNNDYRLACFELQEAVGPFQPMEENYGSDGFGSLDDYGEDTLMTAWQKPTMYSLSFSMNDQTKEIFNQLVKTYEVAVEQTCRNYYDSVTEECNYNIDDGTFNKFFIDSMMAEFRDNPSEAPWYVLPIIYHIHQDIMYNQYDGDQELIKVAAMKDSEMIHPKSGNIYQVEAFKDKMEALLVNYTQGGEIYNVAITVGNEQNLVIGGIPGDSSFIEDTQVDGYAATITNLPTPVNVMMSGFADAIENFYGGDGGAVQIDTTELE